MSRATPRQPSSPPQDLLIAQRIEGMIEYAYVAVRQFPKSERHVLSAQIRLACWELLRLVVIANKRYHKKTTMQDMDAAVDLLRRQIRVAHRLGFLPIRQYEHWARLIDEIGRLTGGWIKSLGQAHAG